jgi:hypothetical protein
VYRGNVYFLFVGLLILLGAEPLLTGARNSGALLQLAFTAVLVVGVFSLADERWAFRLGLALAGIAIAAAVGFYRTDWLVLRVIDLLAIVCFALLAIALKFRHVVLQPGSITLERVVGALCIYLLLGMVWAIFFGLVEIAVPTAFHYSSQVPGDPLDHFLYYSFVTLTTLGYGDITPVHAVARTLAYLEAVVGQLYLAVLVAGLVGRYVASVSSRAEA